MRRLVIYAIIFTVCSLAACGPSNKEKAQADEDCVSVKQENADSIAKAEAEAAALKARQQDSIAKVAAKEKAEKEDNAEAKKIIRKLFGAATNGADVNLKKYCAPRLLNKLASDYDYDGFGYAIWDFRSGAQDGDGPTKILSITPLGDMWYRYDFVDMGFKGAKKVHFVKTNGVMKMDRLITIE